MGWPGLTGGLAQFTDGIDHFERLFAVTPEVVAHDLHPQYLSTQYALERDGVELIGGWPYLDLAGDAARQYLAVDRMEGVLP